MHLWLIAVPENSVNNRFDYPMGLMYLIFVAPFVFKLFKSLWKKEFAVLPWMVVLGWLAWWFGTQQTRYLYIPSILMFVTVIPELKQPSKLLWIVVLLALTLNGLSVVRAHKNIIGKSRRDILRPQDLELVKLSEDYIKNGRQDIVDLEYHDVLFAQFPVRVTKEKLPHTLNIN